MMTGSINLITSVRRGHPLSRLSSALGGSFEGRIMQHEPEFIEGSDLLERWADDDTASEHAGFAIEPNVTYEVRWPEHVHNKRFNGDCTIYPPQ